MNELLDRIDQAYGRQRQFVGDASHELQSPLTSFRAQLEIALAHPERADWAETARSLLAESGRMEKIVTDLLFLAVTDAAEEGRPDALVDFDEVVAEEVGRPRLPSRVSVRLTRTTAAPVRGRSDELCRLVRNLLDNAVHHAESRVELTLDVSGSEVQLRVHDDGPGIPADQQERIFDRFWRAEAARSRTGGGTGSRTADRSLDRRAARRHPGRRQRWLRRPLRGHTAAGRLSASIAGQSGPSAPGNVTPPRAASPTAPSRAWTSTNSTSSG